MINSTPRMKLEEKEQKKEGLAPARARRTGPEIQIHLRVRQIVVNGVESGVDR